MVYNRPISISFGPLNSGQTVTYEAKDTNGTVLIAETSAGLTEIDQTGTYQATISVDYGWGFVVLIWRLAARGLSLVDTFKADDIAFLTDPPVSTGPSTFDDTLPTTRDKLRLRIGDVGPDPQWFISDASINQMLIDYSYDEACAQCAESCAAIAGQKAILTDQPNLRIQYGDRGKLFLELAKRIRDLAAPAPGAPQNNGATIVQMAGPDLSNYLIEGGW